MDILIFFQNLTEFNTAHNRRISMLGIGEDEPKQRGRKRHKFNVSFKDEEDVINPEDVDPSVGRFRNLVQTTVVPSKVSLRLFFNIYIYISHISHPRIFGTLTYQCDIHRGSGIA